MICTMARSTEFKNDLHYGKINSERCLWFHVPNIRISKYINVMLLNTTWIIELRPVKLLARSTQCDFLVGQRTSYTSGHSRFEIFIMLCFG